MTAHRTFHIWCDDRSSPYGCAAKFEPQPGQHYAPLAEMRRTAKEAGWTYVRDPSRLLDRDYCPKHKPEENS